MDQEGKQEGAPVPKGPSRLIFAIRFAFMTTIGLASGSVLISTVKADNQYLGIAQGGILIGALLGLAQWVVVRGHIRRILEVSGNHSTQIGRRILRESVWWAFATAGGMLLFVTSIMIMRLLFRDDDFRSYMTFLFTGMGALISPFIWIMLRRKFPHASEWIWYSLAGTFVGFPFYYFFVIPNIFLVFDIPYIIQLFCFGATLGIFIGTAQAICLHGLEPLWRKRLLEIVQGIPTSTE